MSQASLTMVIYDRYIFIVQATGIRVKLFVRLAPWSNDKNDLQLN
jgi:hypothetical protein